MSFPRAKIQRFNDVMNSVPSPTKYDPKLGDKVKGGCILKSESKHPAVSDTASASSGRSCQTPVFRTPHVPKRHNCVGTAEKLNPHTFKSISFKSDDMELLTSDSDLEELKSLRVECSNKTETIVDLEKHIQDLKTQVSNYEKAKASLESYVSELEVAKSNLECIQSNNENYEQQIRTCQAQIADLEAKTAELTRARDELLSKVEETEKKNGKLEDANLDYERKLISLEGTIEQLQLDLSYKEKLVTELKQNEETYKMNHKVAVECLKGKISTLENEIKGMEVSKGKNEAVIFGLETQISNLNCTIETLRSDKCDVESSSRDLKSRLEEMEAACKNHDDTITGLEMELECRVKELQQLKESNSTLKEEMETVKSDMEKEQLRFEEELQRISESHRAELDKLAGEMAARDSALDTERAESQTKAKGHAEEMLRLQNEYESKLLAQMHENTDKTNALQCQVDEKVAQMNLANAKHAKALAEWEKRLEEAETSYSNEVSKMESEHLDKMEDLRRSYGKKMRLVELNSSRVLDMKNKEIDLLSEQYKEILAEVKSLLGFLEKKDEEIKSLTTGNKNLNSRVKVMLEEIKILNEENKRESENLAKMTAKYNDEFGKNEQLSWKLGELDTTIIHLKQDLSKKVDEWKKSTDELRKSKSLYDSMANKKSDLETTVSDLQSKINRLVKDSNEKRAEYERHIGKLNEEMALVKTQCRRFEIVAVNNSKSLDALHSRLIESEKEVEKLELEKGMLEKDLEKEMQDKEEYMSKYEDMMESEVDLQATLDEYVEENKELTEKCAKLESCCAELEGKIEAFNRLREEWETERQTHMESMRELLKKQELQLIETEKSTLDTVEQYGQTITEKLEFFMKFSTERVRALTVEIKNLKSINATLAESLKSKTDAYDNLFTDHEILKTTVDISVKESEELKKKWQEQTAKLEELEDVVAEGDSEREKLEEKLADVEDRYAKAVEDKENLQRELDDTKALLDEEKEMNACLKDQVSNLESNVDRNEESIKARSERIEDLEKKVQDLEKLIRERDAEIGSHQEEKMLFVQEMKTLTQEKSDLAFDLKVAERKLEASEKLAEDMRNSKLEAEESYKKQKSEFESLFAEKMSLDSEHMCLKDEAERLRQENATLTQVMERKNYYKENCVRLESLNAELREENVHLKNDFNEIHAILQGKEKEISELVKSKLELENLIGPFRDQLEQYETERMLIENDREQLRKQHLEQAAQLGHRNHKQKIQHVVKLKNTLLETRKENEKLMLEIKNLKKKVQKLQEELGHDPKRLFIGGKRPAATPFKGKENSGLMTPTPGLITPMSVKQEPMSPGSPLRNRNQ